MNWRPADCVDRQLGWLWAAVAVGSLALYPFARAGTAALPACPFRSLVGLPCPSCGATRALIALGDGRLGDALQFNPLVTLSAVAFVAFGLTAPWWTARLRRVPQLDGVRLLVRVAVVVAIAANWLWVVTRGI